MNCYKIDNEKVEVVTNSWEHFERIKPDYSIFDRHVELKDKKFFFSIGTLTKHKNLKWVLRVAKNNPQYIFTISGFMNSKKFKKELDMKTPKNVIYLGYLNDGEVKAIYEKSLALLFPSVYEGFGLPPIEALPFGAKVVVSDIPVMHEIFEDTVLYVNPYDYNINLKELLEQKNNPKETILNKYSWKNSAEKLLKILRKEANK